jgi:hypothetical protein
MCSFPEFPLVDRIEPDSVRIGDREVELVLEGRNLSGISEMLFLGGGIKVLWSRNDGPDRLRIKVDIERSAAAGPRYLLLTDPLAGIIVARRQLKVEKRPWPAVEKSKLEMQTAERVPSAGELKSGVLFVNPYDWI